ncbi:MAG: A/G-specific adenine glycosylase [Flavobacteriales bacterium]|nr:A/G-specific adenine glycosylase [Flavobacteriales bacterium]
MHFSKEITGWYHQNKRDLPWRNTVNPYKIWLSEVILQQTRVVQGLSYYLKFIEHFPSVQDLANAKEEQVLKLWQGLGYYSRARNLHFAAKQVLETFNGVFPTSYSDLITLKGVGDYSASAISSFCADEKQAVVDGNVYRVLSRFFGIEDAIDSTSGKKAFKKLAEEVLDNRQPGLHNQAIMEFGALQCVPKNPTCEKCPLQNSCFAFANSKIDSLPRKDKKTKQRNRYFNYLVIHHKNSTYIEQRIGKGIWENLYQFPLIESVKKTVIDNLIQTKEWETIFKNSSYNIETVHVDVKHVLSHQIIYATFIEVEVLGNFDTSYKKINYHELEQFPVPVIISNFIERSPSIIP